MSFINKLLGSKIEFEDNDFEKTNPFNQKERVVFRILLVAGTVVLLLYIAYLTFSSASGTEEPKPEPATNTALKSNNQN